jgi:hypothetical protein
LLGSIHGQDITLKHFIPNFDIAVKLKSDCETTEEQLQKQVAGFYPPTLQIKDELEKQLQPKSEIEY